MQYKTMIFDANRPVVQSITEPLNSGYGIAVKVKKDGEFLPYEQVKVDGKGSNANRDGWACFELETDNEVGVETISIEAGGEGSSSVIKFPLMVNKRDMGYIEPAEDKIQ